MISLEMINLVACLAAYPWLILLAILWQLSWKGVALWKAAGNKHKWWFVALFLVNTMAILEIVYIFGFSKKATPQSANP